MHKYIDMLRQLIMADHQRQRLLVSLRGPRTTAIVTLVREATGLTQRGLADRMDMDHTYLSRVANGKGDAGVPLLEKLYDVWVAAEPDAAISASSEPVAALVGRARMAGDPAGDERQRLLWECAAHLEYLSKVAEAYRRSSEDYKGQAQREQDRVAAALV